MRYLFIVLLLMGFSSIQAIAENETSDELTQQPAVDEQTPGISGDSVKPQEKKTGDALCEQYGYSKGTEEYNLCLGYAEETYVGGNDNGKHKKKRRRDF